MGITLSPKFQKTYKVSSGVAASSKTDVGITVADASRFGPFNVVNINNASGQRIAILPDGDQDKRLVVGDAGDKTWNDISFNRLILENLDSATATDDDIYVFVQRDIGLREFLRVLAQLLGKSL